MPRRKPDAQAAAPVRESDRLFEHRVRLAIAVLLARRDALSFSRLKEVLGETDGSLGAHLRRLEEAGYLAVAKEFVERKPVSWYRLTAVGKKALKRHVAALQMLLSGLGEDAGAATKREKV